MTAVAALAVRQPASSPAAQRGFALVIVLWVLAGLTVIAVVVASSARVGSESVKLLRERVQAETAFLSTSSRIRIIAATGAPRPMSIEGAKGRLLLDGRNASAGSGESVSILDARALVNFNRYSQQQMRALLLYCGAGESQVSELIDSLDDYIDRDNNKRLNGAEAFEYRIAGLPEPRNATLLSREEIWRVKGWAALRGPWRSRGCDEFVTVHNDGRFNANTASSTLLQFAGMTEDAAAATVQVRREGFELKGTQVPTIQGDLFAGLGGGYVGSVMRVTHQLPGVDWILVYDLELTPNRDGGPWRVLEIRHRPRPSVVAENLAELPAPDFDLSAGTDRGPTNAPFNTPFAN